jgi:hypothetical protein
MRLEKFILISGMVILNQVVWSQTWVYDLGSDTGVFSSTTGSTGFLPPPTSGTARVRVGTNPGSIVMSNPGLTELGTNTELAITSNTGSSSTTKFSVYDYAAGITSMLKFKVAFSGGTNGVYNCWIGDGATFSDNTALSNSQVFAGLRWSLGASNTITYFVSGSTGVFASSGLMNSTGLFVQNTSNVYSVEIYANNSTLSANYLVNGSPQTLATGSWDLWVDGVLVGNDLPKAGLPIEANIDSFAFNHQSSASNPGTIYIDDIEYSNVLPASNLQNPLGYLLVQDVLTTGNIPGQSIQVQFDLDWGNTWRDDINWDAVWVFMKYKDANGVWQHAKVSPSGHINGLGTPCLIEPTADQMGAFVRLAQAGAGNFSSEGMQLQWNYGADGLASVSGLEVRVYAIEMVYTPQGDYSMSLGAAAPGNKIPVINSRLSPVLSADGDTSVRIKGDAGVDLDANGTVENTTYPTGYYPFYVFKYEMSEQQYADFLNCLSPAQRTTLGVAGSTITQTGGQYFASMPNDVCTMNNDTTNRAPKRILAYADWSGLRPFSYLEYQKALNGSKASNPNGQMFGVKNLGGSLSEPYVRISGSQFNRENHGNGVLTNIGENNVIGWVESQIGFISGSPAGLRLCRTAE